MLGRHLKILLHDRLDLAESVLYQSGAPTSWNLDFYGRCRVGRAAFGTDRIPDGWAERCNALDEIWLPSEFHARDLRRIRRRAKQDSRRSRRPLTPKFSSRSSLRFNFASVPAKSFRFLAIADGWLASGIDILVRAFIEEFSPDEDVALIIHCPPKRCGDSFIDFEAEVIALIEAKLGKNLEDVPNDRLVGGIALGRRPRRTFRGLSRFRSTCARPNRPVVIVSRRSPANFPSSPPIGAR